jgi:predicted nucleic acid-binding Zn ribbon protein
VRQDVGDWTQDREAGRVAFRDDIDEDDDDEEDGFDHLDDPDDEEEDATVPCPHCRRPVYDDAERCPHCGQYLSREDAPRRHSWWLVLGVMVAVLVVLMWVVS